MTPRTIRKILSANDAGETGGHQAGILIPKHKRILSFFPALDQTAHNPRAHIVFCDHGAVPWEFAFIYYNNRRIGGTRDEYRLTRMTNYIRQAGLASGDDVVLNRDECGRYTISHEFAGRTTVYSKSGTTVLQLGTGWRVIDII